MHSVCSQTKKLTACILTVCSLCAILSNYARHSIPICRSRRYGFRKAVRSALPEVDAAVFYEYIIHTAVAENVCGFRKAAVIQIEAYDGGRTKLQ